MLSAFGVEHGEIAKAFDSEARRHRRQVGYEGATAGGSAAAGVSAARLGRTSRVAAQGARLESAEEVSSHFGVQRDLTRMAQPTATKGASSSRSENISSAARQHRAALGHRREAMKLAHGAKVAGRASRAGAVTSAALAASAYGIRRHDRKSGRSFSYR